MAPHLPALPKDHNMTDLQEPHVTQVNGRWLVHRHPTRPFADLTAGYPTATLGVMGDFSNRADAEQFAYRVMEWREKLRAQ